MKAHPATELFPRMDEVQLADLVEDIRQNGQQVPIVLHEGMILDGRNRWEACERLGIAPKTEEWSGEGPPITWAISINLHRRHLTDDQRAIIAARLREVRSREAMQERSAKANASRYGHDSSLLPPGGNKEGRRGEIPLVSEPRDTLTEAAEVLGVSRKKVRAAVELEREAPDVAQRVFTGDVSIIDARKEARTRQAETEAATGAAILDFVGDPKGNQARAALRREYSAAALRTRRELLKFDPEEIVDALGSADHILERHFIMDCRKWLDQFENALKRGLRVVNGDRQDG